MRTSFTVGVVAPVFLAVGVGVLTPLAASSNLERIEYRLPMGALIVSANSFLQAKSPASCEWAAKFLIYVTAYSSAADETDSTPYLTASGTRVRDGVVASNFFSIGTRLKIPELFGEKVLVVEDRMQSRFRDRIDVWMPSKWEALQFGKKQVAVEIVEL